MNIQPYVELIVDEVVEKLGIYMIVLKKTLEVKILTLVMPKGISTYILILHTYNFYTISTNTNQICSSEKNIMELQFAMKEVAREKSSEKSSIAIVVG